jgi:NADH-quinone oxidoreductase subunit C
VAEKLKTDAGMSFDMCIDVTAIDWLDKKDKRFEVVYFLYSNKFKSRVRIKTEIDENDCTCPTLTNVWASANWYERETYDMYGIKFIGHPDLRRFYMPEDYVNPETGEPIHPLRKDFPLMGIPDSLPLPPYPEKYW